MGDFVREGASVGRGTALEDVSNEDLVTVKVYGPDYLGQELTRTPHEGQPLLVLFRARGLANEDQVGAWISLTGHNVPTRFPESALTASFEAIADFLEESFRRLPASHVADAEELFEFEALRQLAAKGKDRLRCFGTVGRFAEEVLLFCDVVLQFCPRDWISQRKGTGRTLACGR